LPQSYPFMETVRPETLQAQGWKKWLSRITFTRRTNYLKSTPKVGGRVNLAGFGSQINPASSS